MLNQLPSPVFACSSFQVKRSCYLTAFHVTAEIVLVCPELKVHFPSAGILNKLTSVFYTSVLLLIMNFVIALSK